MFCKLKTFVCTSAICHFKDKYGYLVKYTEPYIGGEGDAPNSRAIPSIKTYPFLRDKQQNFTKEDIEAIRKYLSLIIKSLQDLKSNRDPVRLGTSALAGDPDPYPRVFWRQMSHPDP